MSLEENCRVEREQRKTKYVNDEGAEEFINSIDDVEKMNFLKTKLVESIPRRIEKFSIRLAENVIVCRDTLSFLKQNNEICNVTLLL